MHQSYICRSAYVSLNQSNYDMHPSMFSSFVTMNWGLHFGGVPDGIQECATYNPPAGPTEPRSHNGVSNFSETNVELLFKSRILF